MTFRCKNIDGVLSELAGEIARALSAQLIVPLQNLPQPRDFFFVTALADFSIGTLVAPVRTDAILSLVVHGLSADLNLQHLAFRTDYRGMKGAIAVFLGRCDVIVEFVGNVSPQAVHNAENAVTIAHGGNEDAHGANVVNL